uniref:Phosphatidylglycerophosphatase and protein-tyrosine phosphatase 1 n=1 Tax=Plectus sambesii TaxID=2011161 RepID=A0A914VAI2_9BILA
MWKQFVFYPSLGYNITKNYFLQKSWPWYTRIDEVVVLGALPFRSMADELVNKENIGGVVCMVEAHEIEHSWALSANDWEKLGVRYHWLPTADFFAAPSAEMLQPAVAFINEVGASGKSVYVHCKAGRTRSATVVACYLMEKHNWLPNVAIEFMKSKRRQVVLRSLNWRSCNDYRRILDERP